jgi:hypothetical protein
MKACRDGQGTLRIKGLTSTSFPTGPSWNSLQERAEWRICASFWPNRRPAPGCLMAQGTTLYCHALRLASPTPLHCASPMPRRHAGIRMAGRLFCLCLSCTLQQFHHCALYCNFQQRLNPGPSGEPKRHGLHPPPWTCPPSPPGLRAGPLGICLPAGKNKMALTVL